MNQPAPSRLDRILAGVCRNCPACRRARRQPGGLIHRLVQKVEGWLCPFCRAYKRLYRRRSSDA